MAQVAKLVIDSTFLCPLTTVLMNIRNKIIFKNIHIFLLSYQKKFAITLDTILFFPVIVFAFFIDIKKLGFFIAKNLTF